MLYDSQKPRKKKRKDVLELLRLTLFSCLTSVLNLIVKALRPRTYTKSAAHLGRKAFSLFLLTASFVWHRLSFHGFMFNVLIITGLLSLGTLIYAKYYAPYQYIKCPDGYAIRSHKTGEYVPCELVDRYWDAEWQHKRLRHLELRRPASVKNALHIRRLERAKKK